MQEAPPTGGGRGAKFWLWIALVALGFLFIAVNFQKVKINFIIGDTEAPLVIALLIAGGIGFVIGLALPRFRGGGRD
ncbi:MAG: LapA family protein [Solirubrobacterales bacterium]|nr:LapA family protein [Solirubrobacterales bacterium]